MREYVRQWSQRYYIERHWPDNRMSVVESCDSEEEGWRVVERLNGEVEGCWHTLMYVERREVELERP